MNHQFHREFQRSAPWCSLAGLLLTVGLLAFCGCEKGAAENLPPDSAPAPPEVTVYGVKSETVPLIRELPGRTAAFNVAQVRPQVNGIILKRQFEEGAFVREGESLYKIDSSVYRANYDKAVANLKSAELTQARNERLMKNKAASVQDYEDSHYACEKARADVELARLDLDYCDVKAPLSGKIGLSNITVGALVTNGQPQEMAVIQQLDPIYVDLQPAVPQVLGTRKPNDKSEEILPFWQGAKVTITLEDGSRYPHAGRIKLLDNHVEKDMGTVTLRAELPNPDGALLPGMFVRAFVEEGTRREGLLVPQQGVFRDFKGNPFVWLVRDDQTAETRSVKTERTFGNMQLIDEGLAAGDRVIVDGVQFVTEGAPVSPSEADASEMKTSFEN